MPEVPDALPVPSAPTRLVRGAGAPWRGLSWLLARPGLWPLVAVPVGIMAVLLVVALWATLHWTSPLLATVLPPPRAAGVLGNIARGGWRVMSAIGHVVVFLALAVVASFAANVLASPFHEMLSERVEREATGARDAGPSSWSVLLVDAASSVLHSLGAVVLWLSVSCPVGALDVIPVVGPVLSVVLGAIVTAFFVARELLDAPLSRRRWSFRAKLDFCWAHLAETEGMGAMTAVLLAVPGLNLLVLPMAVTGATLLTVELLGEEPDQDPSD